MITEKPTTTTHRGTPCAHSWTDDWIARVEAREDELDRRICGARTIGHAPCPAPSNHPTGRCGHHGGFELTGAPEGNRNAAVHFLYSRRIMPCGPHCPAWKSCPLGGGGPDHGKEILARAYPDRPACPFEQAEYNAVVTDATRRTMAHAGNAWGIHVAHTVALLTIMTSRAARFLATHPFTDDVQTFHGENSTITAKPAAAFIACDKLARELRRWTFLLERCYPNPTCAPSTERIHERRQQTDTNPDPDSLYTAADTTERKLSEQEKKAIRDKINHELAQRAHARMDDPIHHRDTEEHTPGQTRNGQNVKHSTRITDRNTPNSEPNLNAPNPDPSCKSCESCPNPRPSPIFNPRENTRPTNKTNPSNPFNPWPNLTHPNSPPLGP